MFLMIVYQENRAMEEINTFEIEPNKVAEYYRNYQNYDASCNIAKQLSFIEINEDGSTILGSSNMNGRRWDGSLFYFNSPDGLPDQSKAVCETRFSSGVTDAKFLASSDMMAIGEDDGSLSVFGITTIARGSPESEEPSPRHFVKKDKNWVHDDAISAVDNFQCDKNIIVTGGFDKSVLILNAEGITKEVTYQFAHARPVTGVSCSWEGSSNVFATGSLDHLALIWDRRQSQPARLALDAKIDVTSVCWRPSSDSPVLAVGTVRGDVMLVDTRQDCQLLSSFSLSRPVHKLSFSQTSYRDDRHEDFVRGLAWNSNGALYSCGFDYALRS
ncbi:hypothetical protein B566_EDAN016319 [Ephemera danica]|nr:hypothetical protein B566_EDAN016319 [Ephemera danica]